MTVPVQKKRLTFIDVSRSYAIILALLSHALITVGFPDEVGSPDNLMIRQFTRMATPLFVFMFGFMVEFIYVKRARNIGVAETSHRIYVRSFQCYIAYFLTALCAYIGGYRSIESCIASMLFLSEARFGNILRAYSVIMLITPFIIRYRLKFGRFALLLLLVPLLVVFSFVSDFQQLNFNVFHPALNINHLFNIFLGIGPDKGGPSVLGSMSFYLAGMFIASSLAHYTIGEKKGMGSFYLFAGSLILLLCALGYFLIDENVMQAWRLFADKTYRVDNHPAYYIIGTLCSIGIIGVANLLIGSKTVPSAMAYILPIGTSSLVSYTAGNMLLNLFGMQMEQVNPWLAIPVFAVAVLMITRYLDRIPFYRPLNDFLSLRFVASKRQGHQNPGLEKVS